MSLFPNIKYPGMDSPGGWWHKDINPVISIVILIIILVSVFIMGASFARQYIKVWENIPKTEIQEGPVQKILLP